MSAIAECLVSMYRRDGKLTADSVVTAASDPVSPMHDRFEWDDEVAAHEYRLEQARALIREFDIVIEDRQVRRFQFVASTGSYAPIEDAMARPSWRAEIIDVFLRDAAAFEARWANHKHVADTYRKWKHTI